MAKKTKKRPGRQDQSSCMWSFINIFDFRHGRSSQKLLLDKKRGSRRIDGAEYAGIKLESLTDSCQICNESNDTVQGETSAIDSGKISVKELMEEEMGGEQEQKKHGSISSGNAEQIATDDGGHVKRDRRRIRNKMSLDLGADGFVAAGDLVAERPNHRKHKSCNSVDLNEMVEEMCSRIHQNSKHCEDCEHGVKPVGDFSDVEKKLGEATKVLVKHFTDVKSCMKDGKVQTSKELTDALLFLNSNKELFLKLLQDPSSHLVKDIQSLQDIQIEEGKFKVLTGSQMLEQEKGNTKQPSFFWRKFKSQEKNSLKKSDSSEDLSRIVVLKPGPPSSRISDTASACSSSPVSPRSTGDKAHVGKASSPFSFAEFKRRLKHAMRKEQHGTSHLSLAEQLNMANRDKKVCGDPVLMASPSRDHFFIERIPKAFVGSKKVEKTVKGKDGKTSLDPEIALTSEQRVSNIYVEARKHLAEIVGNSDVYVDSCGKKVPKPLGRILAYSGYDSPAISSPRKEVEIRSPHDAECQTSDAKTFDVMPENNIYLPDQAKLESESEPCVISNKPTHENEVPALESHISDDLPCNSTTEDIARSLDATSENESNLLEVCIESCFPRPITKTEQAVYDEKDQSSCQDSSTLGCSVNEKIEDLDVMSDTTSRPSPISVLDPIFKEDGISPRGVKYFIAVEPIRPRHIKFEEETLAPLGRVLSIRSVGDDKYTFDFVKAVVQMSGLSWDELHKRSFLSDHLIDPSLIDEVDFLPDLLPLDFNLLFDIVNEVVVEICWLNFGCMLSLAAAFSQPSLKGKDILDEIWKRVECYLRLEGTPRTLDQIVAMDFAKSGKWADIQVDCENIGIQMEEAILDDLLEDAIFSCLSDTLESNSLIFQPVEEQKSEIIEL